MMIAFPPSTSVRLYSDRQLYVAKETPGLDAMGEKRSDIVCLYSSGYCCDVDDLRGWVDAVGSVTYPPGERARPPGNKVVVICALPKTKALLPSIEDRAVTVSELANADSESDTISPGTAPGISIESVGPILMRLALESTVKVSPLVVHAGSPALIVWLPIITSEPVIAAVTVAVPIVRRAVIGCNKNSVGLYSPVMPAEPGFTTAEMEFASSVDIAGTDTISVIAVPIAGASERLVGLAGGEALASA